jgi:hypothetical protein
MAAKKGMHGKSDRKQRGRSTITNIPTQSPTNPMVQQVISMDANRPGPGKHMNKHRGDRRDTSPTYTTNVRHAARGNNPRRDTSTRAR